MPLRRHAAIRALVLLCAAPLALGSIDLRSNVEERLLAAHNRERSALGIGTLEWDEELARDAAQWAEELSRDGRFEHSPDEAGATPQGENLWGGTPGHYAPETMVGLWIAEKAHFEAGTFPHVSRTGRVEDVSHYTQLIWRRTDKVGCALSNVGAEEILVCRYSSAGNVIGERVT